VAAQYDGGGRGPRGRGGGGTVRRGAAEAQEGAAEAQRGGGRGPEYLLAGRREVATQQVVAARRYCVPEALA